MTPDVYVLLDPTAEEQTAALRAVLDGRTPHLPRHARIEITIRGATPRELERIVAALGTALKTNSKQKEE